ncbi:hypothetical protein HDK90DRAFT_70477 [Phyllosticta capitalensis]|uniref:Uncharacterized protein n=1 Tax=Phyllosticta capitalensis TaxID=121624 RepID=A0ABR1YCN7_9PEZI
MARTRSALIKAGKLITGLYCAGLGGDEPEPVPLSSRTPTPRFSPVMENRDVDIRSRSPASITASETSNDSSEDPFSVEEKCANPETPYRHRETTVWTFGPDGYEALQNQDRNQRSGQEASPSTSCVEIRPKFELSTIFEEDETESSPVTFILPSKSDISEEQEPADSESGWETLSASSTLVGDESDISVVREYGPNPYSYEYPFAVHAGGPCRSISLCLPEGMNAGLELCLTVGSEKHGNKRRSHVPLLRLE